MPNVHQIATMSFVAAAVSNHVRETQTVDSSAWKDVSVMRVTCRVEVNVCLPTSVAACMKADTTSTDRSSTLMPFARRNASVTAQ